MKPHKISAFYLDKQKSFFPKKKLRVSEGVGSKFVLTKFLVGFLKHRVSEIRVKRIRVNQGLSVAINKFQNCI